jgi:Protein of unknown function (DUF2752)
VRFHWRPLIPREKDPELLWGSVLGASALIGSLWLHAGLPTPLCPLHAVTGLPCPTCGSTRAASALVHGHLTAALAWNPLMTLVLTGVALYVLYAAVVVMGNLPRLCWMLPTPNESRWIRIGVVLLLAANWGYLLLAGRN